MIVGLWQKFNYFQRNKKGYSLGIALVGVLVVAAKIVNDAVKL
ncbi:MAG: hypothetical protein P1U63_10575 [Coxiellaceae bacterium]|nr:hypothetical protein [Coxiellaceae bacterium]